MPKSPKYLLVGSTEAYSGKSTTVLGLSHQLIQKGLDIAYGKPLGTCLSESLGSLVEQDVEFIGSSLNLSANRKAPTLLALDDLAIQKRLLGEDKSNYKQSFIEQYSQLPAGDLVLLEGAGNLDEGCLFDMSLLSIAEAVDAKILLVCRYSSLLIVELLKSAKERIGNRLIGVVINDIPLSQFEVVNTTVRPYLESISIPVLGILPKNDLLRSVSVQELVNQLNAQVLCGRNSRLDLIMVESLAIGAMNVNSAVKYFRRRHNMAVVTGGDRVEIQQAALETATQCLILTGQLPPPAFILNRAEELDIPILSVDFDTLTTVEIIDKTFGQVRVHEPIKVDCIRHLMAQHFDADRLLSSLGLTPAAV